MFNTFSRGYNFSPNSSHIKCQMLVPTELVTSLGVQWLLQILSSPGLCYLESSFHWRDSCPKKQPTMWVVCTQRPSCKVHGHLTPNMLLNKQIGVKCVVIDPLGHWVWSLLGCWLSNMYVICRLLVGIILLNCSHFVVRLIVQNSCD